MLVDDLAHGRFFLHQRPWRKVQADIKHRCLDRSDWAIDGKVDLSGQRGGAMVRKGIRWDLVIHVVRSQPPNDHLHRRRRQTDALEIFLWVIRHLLTRWLPRR